MVNYQNGKIYKLWSDESNNFYIGSTTTSLPQRLHQHLLSMNCKKIKSKTIENMMNHTNIRIELIEHFPCNEKSELTAREGYFVRLHREEMQLINQNIPGRSRSESSKDYQENNKEYLAEKSKEYRESHKEEIREQRQQRYPEIRDEQNQRRRDNWNEESTEKQRQYRNTHRDEVNERKRNWNNANKKKKAEMDKRYREANADKVKQKKKEYYEKNKEAINARIKEKRSLAKEVDN